MTPSAAERDQALRRLRTLGVRRILLLTGDNERVARALAAELWIDHRAECPPEEKTWSSGIKLKAIRQHRSQGRDTPENDQVMERIARENGARAGVPMAEAFRVLLPT